ncbi:TPA: preprotein translocase subunit SecG [Candidatus Gastranaerophilales bacterium HUM_3]|jgi:preprotein translocase subunit SecG|nr:preprotein translocase subunit SecG [Acinetobacter sp.]OLA74906.1 MAG: preprotein translocase subunit SecG [Acinetobacter sp. CAG:196_36_41]CCZ51455.1 preprotein translocase SecG subunit [Acinetobacter sp. CAG:196]DAA81787.1 MAG TPA: preprotein translocase subunit SecG [Candidatus Gastranaerophilales bacterium HUM_3]DAA88350.1 MAG TPA: preprotein translocase subunit SecG [Candidatus Gastranaerophilales bacterium HUM_4]DAA90510.1 MAG TPA: preprotein translocase subunit SecG [Candidatus Gastr
MLTIVGAIEVISALLLIVLILMHSPKGDGIAGIGNAAQMFTSQKSAEKGLNKLTGIVAGIFVLCVFLLGFGIIK